jgi:hypothetical protein
VKTCFCRTAISNSTTNRVPLPMRWETHLFDNREFPGSNIKQETGYIQRLLCVCVFFFSVSQANTAIVSEIRPWPLPFTFFSIHSPYAATNYELLRQILSKLGLQSRDSDASL